MKQGDSLAAQGAYIKSLGGRRMMVPRELLSVDLENEHRRRLDAIAARVSAGEKLWRDVCATVPLIENIALRDTLKSIGDFFKWYDYRCMAHAIPCSIDYPLCHPVPETLQGIDYIEEYLRRLMIEADFLRRFELKRVERVLAASSPDYRGPLVNLYEPAATNVIGLVLIGKDPTELFITDEDCAAITRRLRRLGEAARERALREAARAVCAGLKVDDKFAEEYLSGLVPELQPRIQVWLARKDLDAVWARPHDGFCDFGYHWAD